MGYECVMMNIVRYLKTLIRKKIYESIIYADEDIQFEIFSRLQDTYMKHKYMKFRKKYHINENFRFNGNNILFYGDGIIQCGENSYIGELSTVLADENCKVVIGNNCSISHNVRIYTSSGVADQNFSAKKREKYFGDVIIEDGVWIGANVFINPGVKIGFNSVVGANSVITKDIESNAIFGGVPAKLIRYKKKLDESE